MTRDEAFQEWEEALSRIARQGDEAKEEARTILRERLKALRLIAHTKS